MYPIGPYAKNTKGSTTNRLLYGFVEYCLKYL